MRRTIFALTLLTASGAFAGPMVFTVNTSPYLMSEIDPTTHAVTRTFSGQASSGMTYISANPKTPFLYVTHDGYSGLADTIVSMNSVSGYWNSVASPTETM